MTVDSSQKSAASGWFAIRMFPVLFLGLCIIAKSLVDGILSDLWLTDYKVRRLMGGSVLISPHLRPSARRNEFLYSG